MGRVTEMPIAEIKAKALKSKPAPKYFVVEAIPGIEVDYEATGFKIDAQGRPILNPQPKPWPSLFQYRLDSWNGKDLFGYHHFGSGDSPSLTMLCTERIKQLAEDEKWTNTSFQRLRIAGINPFTGLPEQVP